MAGQHTGYRHAPHGRFRVRLSDAQRRTLSLLRHGWTSRRAGTGYVVVLACQATGATTTTTRTCLRALEHRGLVQLDGDEWTLTRDGKSIALEDT